MEVVSLPLGFLPWVDRKPEELLLAVASRGPQGGGFPSAGGQPGASQPGALPPQNENGKHGRGQR